MEHTTLDIQKKKDGTEYSEPGLFDDWNHHVTPRDLTSGVYRGGRRPLDIFRRVTNGVGGTPMAGFATLKEEERWHIVNYVLSIPIEGAFLGDDHERLWITCMRLKRGLQDTGKPGGCTMLPEIRKSRNIAPLNY